MAQLNKITIAALVVCSIVNISLAAPTPPPVDPARKLAVLNYGRKLNRDFSHSFLQNIYSFNNQMRQFANTIPHNSSLHELVVPIHFTSSMSNLAAPYAVRHFVSKPLEHATVSAANWIEQIGSYSNTLANFITSALGVNSGSAVRRPRHLPNMTGDQTQQNISTIQQ